MAAARQGPSSGGSLRGYAADCSSRPGAWSLPGAGANFRRAYAACIERARYANAGVAPIVSARLGSFSGDRVVQWQASGGVVCLKEVWLGHSLVDSAVCLRLGGQCGSASAAARRRGRPRACVFQILALVDMSLLTPHQPPYHHHHHTQQTRRVVFHWQSTSTRCPRLGRRKSTSSTWSLASSCRTAK